jgi:ornithine decarboxylase
MRLIRATPGKKKTVALKPFRFYGPTCTSEDYMPGPFMIPEDVKEGDYIEIGQLGAYGNTMRTAFNGFGEHEIVAISASPMATMYNQTAETEADELQPV